MLEQFKAGEERMRNDPDSVLLSFKQELLDLGFQFEVLNQAKRLLPEYKNIVLPIVIKYYKMAKLKNEKSFLVGWFSHKGFDEVVPMLMEDYFSDDPINDRWAISDALYSIKSKKYIDSYLKTISDASYGTDRQMLVLLVGKLKAEAAIPVLIDLLEDEEVRLHAICALGYYKQERFRPYFERFQNDKHPGWRKYSREALKKLDAAAEKKKAQNDKTGANDS